MSLTNLGYLAYKIQSAAATAVIPTHFLRFNEGDLILEQENIPVESVQNNAFATAVVAGKQTPSGEFTSDLDANECVAIFYGALGTLTSSTDISSGTDASVLSHQIDYGASLPNWSIEQGRGDLTSSANNLLNYDVRRAFGAQIESFTLKGGNGGKLEFSWKFQSLGIFQRGKMLHNEAAGSSVVLDLDTVEGLVSGETVNMYDDTPQNETDAIASLSAANKTITIATLGNSYTRANNAMVFLTPLSPSFSTAEQVMTMADVEYREGATASAAASASESNIENWELMFNNNLDARPGSLRRGPYVVAPTKRGITLKFTKYFESKRDADRWLSIEKRGIELKITNNIVISATDTLNAKYQIKITLSNMRILSHKMSTTYGELYAYDIEMIGLYDSSDTRAIRIVVQNASAGTVYTA